MTALLAAGDCRPLAVVNVGDTTGGVPWRILVIFFKTTVGKNATVQRKAKGAALVMRMVLKNTVGHLVPWCAEEVAVVRRRRVALGPRTPRGSRFKYPKWCAIAHTKEKGGIYEPS